MKKELTKEEIIERNKKLIEEYPFLLPRNRWTDKVPEDYDYSYTELDAMPQAWRDKFGEKMCKELKKELVKKDYLDDYRITQIKSKYASLRWYDFGHTNKMEKIIEKYERLSTKICECCGKRATITTQGWIMHLCKKCYNEYYKKSGD